MIKHPEYGEDIIVLVKYEGLYSWFLSEKTIWVMNYVLWMNNFNSHEEVPIIPERKGLEILNTDNWLDFKRRNLELLVSRKDLNNLITSNLPILSWDDKGELFPTLFLDFDRKVLKSLFPEILEFEKYVPEDWVGLYEDFYSLIPDDEKYWIIDGVDHFPRE